MATDLDRGIALLKSLAAEHEELPQDKVFGPRHAPSKCRVCIARNAMRYNESTTRAALQAVIEAVEEGQATVKELAEEQLEFAENGFILLDADDERRLRRLAGQAERAATKEAE